MATAFLISSSVSGSSGWIVTFGFRFVDFLAVVFFAAGFVAAFVAIRYTPFVVKLLRVNLSVIVNCLLRVIYEITFDVASSALPQMPPPLSP